ARGVRRARRLSTDAADPVQAEWRMRTSVRYDEDGTLVLTTRLPAERGALVLAALEAARAQIDAERRAESSAEESGGESSAEESPDADPANRGAPGTGTTGRDQQAADDAAGDEPEREPERDRPAAATLADAVVRIAQDSLVLRAREHPDRARRDRSRLQVAVDPLSGWARLADGELLPPPVTKTLLPALAGGHDHPGLPGPLRPLRITDLTARDLGRSRREPDRRLRELIGLIDGERCRFPGCTRSRKLHAHHVLFWSMGGRTDLANLVLLCARHHTIVHADGFLLRLRPDRTLEVRQADGTVVEHRPALPWRPAAELDLDARIGAATLLPAAGADRLHLEYAVWVLLNQAA
ncbi:MAG TPA: HNH endonuclease signature motif containing protein, partial [Mycobacteriales bacterium]|nr:HNH endonuclease signature motif containing protein [Mycobacteriales bacterium]